MKKTLKILTITLLAAVMLLTFASCSDTEDASDIYTKAKEKTDSLKSFNAEMTINRDFVGDKDSFKDKSTIKVMVDRSEADSPVYLNTYCLEFSGNDVETKNESSTYYADSIIYQKTANGEKYMQLTTAESVSSQFSSVAIDIPVKAFEKSRVYVNDGLTQVVAEPKVEVVQKLLESFISGMEAYYTPVDSASGFNFEYSTVSLSLDINEEGYFEKMGVEFKATFDHAEGVAAVNMKIAVDFIDPGKDVTVEEPSDLSEYTWYENVDMTEEEWQGQMTNEVLALYDENNNPIPEYDETYLELCAKYGKEAVDSIVDTFEMLKTIQG